MLLKQDSYLTLRLSFIVVRLCFEHRALNTAALSLPRGTVSSPASRASRRQYLPRHRLNRSRSSTRHRDPDFQKHLPTTVTTVLRGLWLGRWVRATLCSMTLLLAVSTLNTRPILRRWTVPRGVTPSIAVAALHHSLIRAVVLTVAFFTAVAANLWRSRGAVA